MLEGLPLLSPVFPHLLQKFSAIVGADDNLPAFGAHFMSPS